MSTAILSLLVKMLNNVNSPREYIEFVRREVPVRVTAVDQDRAYRMCKLAFAASRTPNYELVQSRNPQSFRRAIAAMCGADGSMRMLDNGKIYRITNLKFSSNVVSDYDIAYIVEALEMTMAYVVNDYADEM